jgi:hypothetical protein
LSDFSAIATDRTTDRTTHTKRDAISGVPLPSTGYFLQQLGAVSPAGLVHLPWPQQSAHLVSLPALGQLVQQVLQVALQLLVQQEVSAARAIPADAAINVSTTSKCLIDFMILPLSVG